MWPVHLSVEQNWATGFSRFSSVDNIFTKKCSLGLTETSHQIKKKRQRQKRPLTLKHLLSAFSKQKVSHFCFKTTCYSASHNVFKKVKKQPYKLNALFWFEILFFFHVLIFPFSISLRKWKKKLSQVTLTTSGHPYNFFPQIFQFSLQTEKPPWAQPTWEFTVLSTSISPKPKKMGNSFHQVIPTRIKVFSRCKNTENAQSCGCLQWAERNPGEKIS